MDLFIQHLLEIVRLMPTMVVGKEELVVSGRIEMRDRFSGRSMVIDQQEDRLCADGRMVDCRKLTNKEGSCHVECEAPRRESDRCQRAHRRDRLCAD